MMNTLELTIEQAKEKVNVMEAIDRLSQNKDFITVILEGYLEKEAVRLVHAKADPGCTKPETQVDLIKQIDAIGCFTGYLRALRHSGMLSQKAIIDSEQTREEILAERM